MAVAAERVSVKIPPFWKTQPDIWFIQLEAQFTNNNITVDSTKYNYVVGAIESDVLDVVADYIRNPPADNVYEGIKERLIRQFSITDSEKLRKLLSEMTLGDRKPSQLLRDMNKLGGDLVSEKVLKSLWLQQLPAPVQMVLVSSSLTLPKLASLADELAGIEQPQAFEVNASSSKIMELEQMVSELSQQVEVMKFQRNGQTERAQSRPWPRRVKDNKEDPNLCWYHNKFGNRARSCKPPCKWKKQPQVVSSLGMRIRETNNLKLERSFVSHRLVLRDPNTGIKFLIDTGSDVSIIPRSPCDKQLSKFVLFAANNSKIATFGSRNLVVSLGFNRNYTWPFIVAQVDHAIIGADFLHNFKILIDLRHNRLIDSNNQLSTQAKISKTLIESIHTVSQNCKYHELLKRFPNITTFNSNHNCEKHHTSHIISTEGPPVSCKARRLSTEKLNGFQEEPSCLCSTTAPIAVLEASTVMAKGKDEDEWTHSCVGCQRSKIGKHTFTPFKKFQVPDERFQVISMDLVGPLPVSNGFTYCLTCIDRFSCWAEAFPIVDIRAETVALSFYSNWISRFGTPLRVITDQGRQFEGSLFTALSVLMGCEKVRTTPYHPQANGKIERWHRTIKAAIMAKATQKWTEVLPTILLGLHSTVREDVGVSPAELVYGTTLRLPGEFFECKESNIDTSSFIIAFKEKMKLIRPIPNSNHSTTKTFISPTLNSASHVFIRRDAVKKPLQPPYEGPFPVIARYDKYYTINCNGKESNISIDRLKPAFLLPRDEIEHDHNYCG